MAIETTTSCQLVQNFIVCAVATFKTLLFVQSRHSKLYCLCSRDIQNFIVCAVATFKTLLFVQSRHSKLYCLCSRDIRNFIVCAIATFKTLLFVQSRHSKLYCLCSRDIQNFIVCAVETFETLLFVQSRHSKLYCLCSRAIRNFLVCVSLLGLRRGGGAVTRGGFIPALEIFLNPSTLAGQLTGRFRNHPFCQGRQLDVWDCPKKSPKFWDAGFTISLSFQLP